MWKKKFVNMAVFILFLITGISITGCSRQPVFNQNSQEPSVTQSNSAEGKVHIIDKILEEADLGPLSEENVSIGDIHLGDSQQQVLKSYGEPSKKTALLGNYPAPQWQYEKLGLSILFTLSDKTVYNISISSPSNLRTNTGIGIDSPLEDIVRIYGKVYGYKPVNNSQTIFITGSKRSSWSLPYPSITITLENGQVKYIGLYTPSE